MSPRRQDAERQLVKKPCFPELVCSRRCHKEGKHAEWNLSFSFSCLAPHPDKHPEPRANTHPGSEKASPKVLRLCLSQAAGARFPSVKLTAPALAVRSAPGKLPPAVACCFSQPLRKPQTKHWVSRCKCQHLRKEGTNECRKPPILIAK